MGENARYRRKQYLVAKRFQLKYAGLILLLVLLTGILCSYVVYYTAILLLGDKLANVYPQGRLVSIVNMVNFRILLSLLIVAPFVVMIGIYASHRIAGPIYRIEKFLDSMAAGEFTSALTLRKNDELINLANGINRLTDSIKTSVRGQKAQLQKTSASLDNLKSVAESQPLDKAMLDNAIDRLSEELNKVNRELDKYKV